MHRTIRFTVINSLSYAIDDFTAKFSTFSNFPFIDIAGNDKDAVFIATKSSGLIKYKDGLLTTIGPTDGLQGTINSIGFDFLKTVIYLGYGGNTDNDQLLIATSKGILRYVLKDGSIIATDVNSGDSQIFESTFRSNMMTYVPGQTPAGNVFYYYPTICATAAVSYGGYVFLEGNVFGHHIQSAYYTNGEYYHANGFSIFGYQFWATENGLFRNQWDYSYRVDNNYNQYLNGVNINKITSIYGLNNFGSYTRENLLIGSTN